MIQDGHYPALLLNADWQPVQMHPLSTVSWQDAIRAVVMDRVTVVEEYDIEIHSATQSWRLPSVVALRDYIKRDQSPTFSRYNVYVRDDFTCQYCGNSFETRQLTFDHVIPRAHGGKSTWQNVVAACSPCNHRKGSMLPKEAKMFPINTPREPSSWDLYGKGRRLTNKYSGLHESWRDYLYWDLALEA
jgi:5-methylcytosine-specific restriction endonuclease McrA